MHERDICLHQTLTELCYYIAFKGSKTAAAAIKAELAANRWIVRQGVEEVEEPSRPNRQLPPEMTAENVLQEASTMQITPFGFLIPFIMSRARVPASRTTIEGTSLFLCSHRGPSRRGWNQLFMKTTSKRLHERIGNRKQEKKKTWSSRDRDV